MRLRMCEKSSTSRAPTSPLKGLAHLEITFLSHVNVRTIITRNAAHTTRVRQSDRIDR